MNQFFTDEEMFWAGFLRFLDVLLNPFKSIVPWAIGGALLYGAWNNYQVKRTMFESDGIKGLTKDELRGTVERLRVKSDRLIVEKQTLKKELDKCRRAE